MRNHVHFIAIPFKEDSLAKTFNTVHMRYSQYFNKKLRRRGHLWQGRFYSCILDDLHLISAARYIEKNPVRVGIVEKQWQWPWSSAIVHTNEKATRSIELGNLFELTDMTFDSWKRFIDMPEEESFLQRIRKDTINGRPLGSSTFIEKLEEKLGRRLHMLPIGRPKATKNSRCP